MHTSVLIVRLKARKQTTLNLTQTLDASLRMLLAVTHMYPTSSTTPCGMDMLLTVASSCKLLSCNELVAGALGLFFLQDHVR